MTYAAKVQQQITRYTPEDRPALVRFQREVFGPDALQLNEDHFEWLFERNPYRRAGRPQFWICKKDEEVVGQQGGVPFELKVDRQYLRASWAIDLMVHPRWRLRGVGPALSENYVATNEVTLGLGITDAAYKAFLRAGWMDLGSIPLYVRPLDVRRMLEGRSSGDRPACLAGMAGRPLVRLTDAACEAYARCRGVTIEHVDRFDERVDALWPEAAREYAVLARRDLRSLKWRFDAVPRSTDYQRLYLLERDRLRGYAVVRMGARHGATAGIIIDYLSTIEYAAPLFARCVEHLRAAGAAAVYCCTLNHRARARMRAVGFVPRESGVHFMARLGEAGTPLPHKIANRRDWLVTTADSDRDHHHATNAHRSAV